MPVLHKTQILLLFSHIFEVTALYHTLLYNLPVSRLKQPVFD